MQTKFLWALALLLMLSGVMFGQTPTQVKLILPGTPSQIFNWNYNTADEASIDEFVLQRTDFLVTTTITSPYSIQIVIPQKTIRSFTFTLPTVTAGQKAFFRMIARKVGLADSAPSNVVEIDVVATPPAPSNLSFP